jgi:hypothetical protein
MTYKERYIKNPDLIKKLDKINYLIQSMGNFEGEISIDFDVDMSNKNGEVYSLSIYVGETFEFDGLVNDLHSILNDTENEILKILQRIKLDTNLNLNKSFSNTIMGGMITELNYRASEGMLTYELQFYIEI